VRHAPTRPVAALILAVTLTLPAQGPTHADGAKAAVSGGTSSSTVAAGATAAAIAAAKDPLRLRQINSKTARVQVQWKATKRTKKYLVEAFSDARLKNLVASKRTKKTNAWIGGGEIRENAKLWIRVTTIDRPKKLKSAKLRVYTGVRAPARPTGVSVRPQSPSTMHVTWDKAKYATGYTVQLQPNPDAAPVLTGYVKAPATTLDLGGIDPAALGLPAQFAVTVRADRHGKAFATSTAVPAAMPFPTPVSGPGLRLEVGSFNVLGVTYNDALGRSYWDRVPLLGAIIQGMGADILGVQEAAWSIKAGYPMRPVAALAAAAGMTIATDPATGAECAAMSDHIFLRPGLFTVEACGEDYLGQDSGFRRYLTWAQLRHVATGQALIAASTHLSVGSSQSVNNQRLAQTNLALEFLGAHNPSALPVILTGDLNATAQQYTTTPAMVLAGAGLASADLVAPTATNAQYGTAHNFKGTNTAGARIDYILASPKVAVHDFRVYYASPAADQPSDHYPVGATLTVYP
jgi:endonuclease/exonuclease/phosphatase family metal-dependent hydrolase